MPAFKVLTHLPRGMGEQTTGQTFHKIVKKVKILEIGDYIIWNHHEKCIQTSTNMPGVGSSIR